VEGKLETLADKIYERFVNRFFNDESKSPLTLFLFHNQNKRNLTGIEVFVDVQGDKYLARIIKTFPPKTLPQSTSILEYHPLAANLNLEPEEVLESDDPMKYFYSARLIVEGSEWSGSGEEFEGSLMEVQADKISYVVLFLFILHSSSEVHGLTSSRIIASQHLLPARSFSPLIRLPLVHLLRR